MIQVARLNLRMQKELKLLHYDPPPGVSSVRLADDQTLTNINAQIHGPEGTVYALGLFHIKILIPERYPFHPPNVTFTTPIYHPNIDDGGRICLDILNLPPKGAWQPSLNISTVLTSIGLLLSEPNPDDGLKCEASREYKYSRPAFDQKARSWTQKYAKPGNNSGGTAEACPPALVQPIVELENAAVERILGTSGKEMTGGRKLSLGSTPRSDVKSNSNGKENKMPTGCVSTSLSHRLSLTHSQIMPGSFSEPLRLLHGSGRGGANGELPEGTIAESDVKKAEAGESPTPMQQQLKVVVEQKVSTIIVPDSESDDEGPTKLRRLSLKRIRSEGKRKAIVPPD